MFFKGKEIVAVCNFCAWCSHGTRNSTQGVRVLSTRSVVSPSNWWSHYKRFHLLAEKKIQYSMFLGNRIGLWCASDIQHLRAIVPLPFLPFFFALPHDGTQIQRIKNDLIRNLLTIWKFNFKFQNLSLSPCISRFYFHIQSDKSPPPPPSSREAFLRTCYHVKAWGQRIFLLPMCRYLANLIKTRRMARAFARLVLKIQKIWCRCILTIFKDYTLWSTIIFIVA